MNEKNNSYATVSIQALKRMPYYLQHLKKLESDGVESISAPYIADILKLNEIQVRKDFAAISTTRGKPKSGFKIKELIFNMENFLGYNNNDDAVLIGVGSLGKALLSYNGFEHYGMNIVAAFDISKNIIGNEVGGKKVLHVEKTSEICRRLNIHIGIITVPEETAQIVCDQLVAGGVSAIWNFAPVHLSAPENILIQNENMAASLALLSKHLQQQTTVRI